MAEIEARAQRGRLGLADAAVDIAGSARESVLVFPHLVTLSHQNYQIYEFTGTQAEEGQIAALSSQLSDDAVVYVHTEQFEVLCRACWENPDFDHAHDEVADDHRIVTGKICASPALAAKTLRAELDRALEGTPHIRLLAPELSRAAGDHPRAEIEERRMSMIRKLVAITRWVPNPSRRR